MIRPAGIEREIIIFYPKEYCEGTAVSASPRFSSNLVRSALSTYHLPHKCISFVSKPLTAATACLFFIYPHDILLPDSQQQHIATYFLISHQAYMKYMPISMPLTDMCFLTVLF